MKVLFFLADAFPTLRSLLTNQSDDQGAFNRSGPYGSRHFSYSSARSVNTAILSVYFVALRRSVSGDERETEVLQPMRDDLLSLLVELDTEGRRGKRPAIDFVKGEIIAFYEHLLTVHPEFGINFVFSAAAPIDSRSSKQQQQQRQRNEIRVYTKLLEMYVTAAKDQALYNNE